MSPHGQAVEDCDELTDLADQAIAALRQALEGHRERLEDEEADEGDHVDVAVAYRHLDRGVRHLAFAAQALAGVDCMPAVAVPQDEDEQHRAAADFLARLRAGTPAARQGKQQAPTGYGEPYSAVLGGRKAIY
jgi:hypothetical protein